MKRFEFFIDKNQIEWIFNKPIRNKYDILIIVIKTVKIMLLNLAVEESIRAGRIILQVSDMSRLFFVSEHKIFSICFPFFVQFVKGKFRFYSHSHENIDSKTTSDLLSLLIGENEIGVLEHLDVLDFAEPIVDACAFDSQLWALFRDLLIYENGYIRYDYDTARSNGHKHPLNHLDVFYSPSATFKLGMQHTINHDYFTDILDIATNCHYVISAK